MSYVLTKFGKEIGIFQTYEEADEERFNSLAMDFVEYDDKDLFPDGNISKSKYKDYEIRDCGV